jgi:type III secretion protein J
MRFRSLALALAALSLAACTKQELLHDLDERDANEVVVLLDRHHINASKVPDPASSGNKGVHYMISVSGGDANDAWRILTDNHMPQKKDNGYAEVFATAGLIPTASEEKAKMLAAIEGELARTIKSMDGVLDARVHVVIPEDSVLKIKEGDKSETTAAVWFQYLPRAGKAPVTEQQIADLIASSVEGLKPEHVKVIGTQALPQDSEAEVTGGGELVRILGLTIHKADVNKFKLMVAGGVLLIVLFALGFVSAMLKAASAGSRLRPGPPMRMNGDPPG